MSTVDLDRNSSRHELYNALESLLNTYPFESISVKLICKEAGLNRSTFYKQFKSKYDLLHYAMVDIFPVKFFRKNAPSAASGSDYHRLLFQEISSHQTLWKNLLIANGVSNYVSEYMNEGMHRIISIVLKNNSVSETLSGDTDIIARMYCGAFTQLIIWWLKDNCQTPVEQLETYLLAFAEFLQKKPQQLIIYLSLF